MRCHVVFALAGVICLSACDLNRTADSKKQSAANLDLQAKCAHDTSKWFSREWMPEPKGTVLLNYTNHYNSSQNKCFAVVEYHFQTDVGSSAWANELGLWNVYEHRKVAHFMEEHPDVTAADRRTSVDDCSVDGKICNSMDEFQKLTYSYMNE